MTPSGWHDDASGRDAGHDEMQIAVFDYLRDQRPEPMVREGEGAPFSRVGVHFEMPFCSGDRVVAFGDVVVIWDQQKEKFSKRIVQILEIKPKIYSIGAVIRQCTAMELTVKSALTDRWRGGPTPIVMAVPVVKSDDPKLPLLRHVFCAAAWDGSALS